MAAVEGSPLAAPRWHDPRLLETRTLDTPVAPPKWASLEAWEARAGALRTQVLAAAGLWADPATAARTPPRAEVFERTDHPDLGYSVEKVFFESLPGYFVTGNLYRPSPGDGRRRAAVLHPHGHAAHGRLQHDQLFSPALRGITFARMGYVALTYDMAGYGDNLHIPHRWGGPREWLWGATPLGLQLWNSIRGLDFLCGLPDVDPERLGCTGESGGGTQTFLLTAVDPRVRVSAPVNMVSLHMQGGCVCENAPGLRLDTNNVEIAALAAPRPLLMVSATGDWTVNTPDVEYPAVAAIYGLYGASDRVSTVQIDAPHNYNRESREAVYPFFARWLPPLPDGEVPGVPSEDDVPGPDREEDLRIFSRRAWPACPEGEAAVANVTAWFRGRAEDVLEGLGTEDAAGVGRLREALLPYLEGVTGVQRVKRQDVQERADGDLIWLSRRGRQERFAVRRVAGEVGGAPAWMMAPDGATYEIFPFGTGAVRAPWARSGRAADVEFFTGYNRTDAAWRAQDLLTALAWAGGRVATMGAGAECAVAATLARAVAGPDAVGALDVELGPEWDAEGLEEPWLAPGAGHYLPGVLRAGGLAGLLAMAAPGRLRVRAGGVLGRGPLRGVRALYAALGAAEACAVE